MTGYTSTIIDATGCSALDALEVEELMRSQTEDTHSGCLDYLNPIQFKALAQRAYRALPYVREALKSI